MKPLRVVLIAAAVGSVLGTAWAFHREAQDLEALRAQEEAQADLEAVMEPPLPPASQNGRVRLPAVEGLPQYPGAYVRPISSGANIDVAWFGTPDSPEQVLDFYEKQFTEQRLLAVRYEYSPFAGYAGYMDLKDHRMHLVSVLRQGEETLVFPSTSYPEKMLEGGAHPPPGVPNIAGAEGSLAFDFGQGAQKRQLWLATFPGTVDEVTEAWRKGLTAKGLEVKRSEGQGETRLEAAGVQVAIRRDVEKVAVLVTTGGGL